MIPETTTLIVMKVRSASDAKRRNSRSTRGANAHELRERPGNTVATLCQVDNDQASKDEPHDR
jgi:hypothetical protein